jgi:hypothetical protein
VEFNFLVSIYANDSVKEYSPSCNGGVGGQTGGAIGLSLTFLVLFMSRQKEQKEKIIKGCA